jgi:hypothetical protein
MTHDAELPGLEAMPEKDQEAIGRTLGALLTGFGQRNADLLVGVYADDADWVNAFGTAKTGAAQIVDTCEGFLPTPTSMPGSRLPHPMPACAD